MITKTQQTEQLKAALAKTQVYLSRLTMLQLVEAFEHTETIDGEHVIMARGFMMDEFESRDIEKAMAWTDSDEASPRKFFL